MNLQFGTPINNPVLVLALLALIILISPLIFRRLRIPGIVGLIIAGIAIGPNGFNVLAKDMSISLFSSIGLLYLMFLAGLEIVYKDFSFNKKKSLVFGALTFLIPIIMGFAVSYYLLDFQLKSALLLASLFSTHTLISYPVASRLGILKNRVVPVTVGGTIITDSAVLLLLAIITASTKGEIDQGFWFIMAAKLIAFVVFVGWVIPKISKWVLKHNQGDNSSQFMYVLVVLFISGYSAELAGIEPIIGAFLAGLALNRLIPQTSPLMNRVVFIGNTLFIPFFLISVGMLIDFKVIFTGSKAIIIASILLTIAVVSKYIAAWLTQLIFKYTRDERNLIFGLSSAHAAAIMAVALVGFKIGLLSNVILNSTVLLILVSCLISSFVTESVGRKIAITMNNTHDNLTEDSFERILVPISNPDSLINLIDFALIIKNPESNEPIYPLTVASNEEALIEKNKNNNNRFNEAKKHASSTESIIFPTSRIDLSPFNGISRAIKELMISHTIMGWNPNFRTENIIFGSILNNLVNLTTKMILVVKNEKSLSIINKIVLIVPVNAEYEIGFIKWVNTINQFSLNIKKDVDLYCSPSNIDRIKYLITKSVKNTSFKYREFNNWENLNKIKDFIKPNNFICFITARPRTISYNRSFEYLPRYLSNHFADYSFLLLYPEQKDMEVENLSTYLENLSTTPIQNNFERVNKLGSLVKSFLKRRSLH